jgi:uncharacterized phage-associated protein
MPSVFDVVQYILQTRGLMTAMKLQKLVYYCQAWSLVWDERPMFPERIEAWANGPVVPALFDCHRRLFQVNPGNFPGDPSNLDQVASETIDAVLSYYGDKTSQWLIDLTHNEDPWKDARKGLPQGVRGHQEISLASMADYYSSIQPTS